MCPMKRILIIGEHSYIGTSFQRWMAQYYDKYEIDVISSRNHAWEEMDFGGYDTILHLAGIAHVDAKSNMEELYYQINRDLTIACCQKAKKEKAGQFIFLSSIIVYGESKSLEPIVITKDTKPVPNGFYGNSKLEAEQGILPMEDDKFHVAVVRPPMVYGKNSKGNYPKLSKLAKKVPIFPAFENQRSMIHIDHLCECLRWIIDSKSGGIFCPQNKEYVSTVHLVKTIAQYEGKKVWTTRCFNPMIRILARKIGFLNKVFGSLCYDKAMSDCFDWSYCVSDFEETIEKTER